MPRRHAWWFEPVSVLCALMAGMLLVMWAQRPIGCALSSEAPRRLVLSRETDREHLASDLASVDRIARRYAAATSDADQQRSRLVECEATLRQQIVAAHGVSPDRLHAH